MAVFFTNLFSFSCETALSGKEENCPFYAWRDWQKSGVFKVIGVIVNRSVNSFLAVPRDPLHTACVFYQVGAVFQSREVNVRAGQNLGVISGPARLSGSQTESLCALLYVLSAFLHNARCK